MPLYAAITYTPDVDWTAPEQAAGMGDRHQWAARQLTGEHHGARTRGVNQLAGGRGQVDAAVAGLPVG